MYQNVSTIYLCGAIIHELYFLLYSIQFSFSFSHKKHEFLQKPENNKNNKNELQRVILKGFSLSNCTTKFKCWVVKVPRHSGHPSTKGRIRMQYEGCRKDSRKSKQRQFSYVGGLQKNWCSHLSRAYPRALKNTHTYNETHNTTKQATGSADKRQALELCHLPLLIPTVCLPSPRVPAADFAVACRLKSTV